MAVRCIKYYNICHHTWVLAVVMAPHTVMWCRSYVLIKKSVNPKHDVALCRNSDSAINLFRTNGDAWLMGVRVMSNFNHWQLSVLNFVLAMHRNSGVRIHCRWSRFCTKLYEDVKDTEFWRLTPWLSFGWEFGLKHLLLCSTPSRRSWNQNVRKFKVVGGLTRLCRQAVQNLPIHTEKTKPKFPPPDLTNCPFFFRRRKAKGSKPSPTPSFFVFVSVLQQQKKTVQISKLA